MCDAYLLVGVDGRTLVMRHELVEGRELPLSDAVQSSLHVHPEVLIPSRSLQRHGEVTDVRLGVPDILFIINKFVANSLHHKLAVARDIPCAFKLLLDYFSKMLLSPTSAICPDLTYYISEIA